MFHKVYQTIHEILEIRGYDVSTIPELPAETIRHLYNTVYKHKSMNNIYSLSKKTQLNELPLFSLDFQLTHLDTSQQCIVKYVDTLEQATKLVKFLHMKPVLDVTDYCIIIGNGNEDLSVIKKSLRSKLTVKKDMKPSPHKLIQNIDSVIRNTQIKICNFT